MPKFITGRTPVKTAEKNRRAKSYRVYGYKDFIDPFPLGFGTLPEKIVYHALSKRNIPFLYLNDLRFVFPEIEFDKTYQADFVIPSLRIIIEVNGAYFHSKPSTIESDAYKYAVYEHAGYKVLAWWDYEILDNITKLFMAEPLLAAFNAVGTKSTEIAPALRTKTDTSKGIRTLNKKRGARLLYRKPAAAIRLKKSKYGSYAVYGK